MYLDMQVTTFLFSFLITCELLKDLVPLKEKKKTTTKAVFNDRPSQTEAF